MTSHVEWAQGPLLPLGGVGRARRGKYPVVTSSEDDSKNTLYYYWYHTILQTTTHQPASKTLDQHKEHKKN
eukprot:scaffold10909_cov172-Amphora_coffeaeformis.AAC.11